MKTNTFLLAAAVIVAGCGAVEPITNPGASSAIEAGDGGAGSTTGPGSGTTADSGTTVDAATASPMTNDCADSDMKYLGAPGGGVARSDGIMAAVPVDYLSVRFDSFPQGAVAIQTMVVEERGAACASATNVAACNATLAALRSENDPKQCVPPEWGGQCGGSYLAYTRGDTVGIVRTKADALAFFGTIDTSKEAYWLSRFEANLYPRCFAPPIASSRMIVDGFEIVLVESVCNAPEFEVLLRVHRDGTTEIVERKSLGTKGLCA
jgi:hypothetical protein